MSVEEILHQIEMPSEEERLTLERKLARRLNSEWNREATRARAIARARGISQATIDDALSRRRYRQNMRGSA
jgi:hypothetical protein